MIFKAIKLGLAAGWAKIGDARSMAGDATPNADTPPEILNWSTADYVAAACVFAFVVATNINTVLNNAYSVGSTLFDSTIFQTIIWRSGWTLKTAPVIGGTSFLNYHISLINYLPNAVSYLLPIDRMSYLGLVYGTIYASLVVVVFGAFRYLLGGRTIPAAVGCLLFYLCGAVSSGQWEPHQEIASGLFTAAFFLAWGTRRRGWAILALALNAAVREDCGILLALPLFLIGIHDWMRRRGKGLDPDLRHTLYLATLSALLSVVSFVVRISFFYQIDTFSYYYGADPFSHLSLSLLMARLQFILAHGQYLWLPGLALLTAAIWLRDIRLFFGWAAFFPYWLFNFLSIEDVAGDLRGYKAFPLILTMIWPAVLALRSPRQMRYALAAVQALVLLSGTIAWENGGLRFAAPYGIDVLIDRWTLRPETENGTLYRSFESKLGNGGIGTARASQGALALYPYSFPSWDKSWLGAGSVAEAEKLDSILWFQGDRDQTTTGKWIESGHFPYYYHVIGTRLAIATRKRLDTIPRFSGAIESVVPAQ